MNNLRDILNNRPFKVGDDVYVILRDNNHTIVKDKIVSLVECPDVKFVRTRFTSGIIGHRIFLTFVEAQLQVENFAW